MASTLATVAFIYKKLYSKDAPGDLSTRDHVLLSKLAKRSGFGGSSYDYSIRHANPNGVSADFTTAQANVQTSKGLQLSASRVKKYGIVQIDGEALAASTGEGAMLDLVSQETTGVLEEVGDHLAFEAYRDGNAARGIRSSESTDVTTLTIADDARNFKVGMTVVASPNADGSSPRTGTTLITSVDEDAGTIGLDTSDITSYADSDYLFASGDQAAGADGLAALFPLTAPTSGDSFRGVDRSVDPRRQAGVRVDDTGTTVEENAGLVAVKIAQVGKKADSVFVNPVEFWNVARRLNAKVQYTGGGKAKVAFEYIEIHTPAGSLRMYSDADCPTNRGYVLNLKSLYIKHLLGFPHFIQDDKGKVSLRMTAADSIEARVRAMWNIICTTPGANGVFSI